MFHILFAGPANTGKTTTIRQLATQFLNRGFTLNPAGLDPSDSDTYGVPNGNRDFYALLGRGQTNVVFYSWSDTESLITWLKNYLTRLSDEEIRIDFVVMACRDGSEPLNRFTLRTLSINEENSMIIPMGRMVRGTRRAAALQWYLPALLQLVNERLLPAELR